MASTSNPLNSFSSSSSSMSRRNYDVFLSFRGPDNRLTFIGHLYNALQQKGLYVFKDSNELEVGQKRSDLFDAIDGSRVAVVTFSENYAHSKWCLEELQKIMECKDQGKITVFPIFYHVTPGEVRLHVNDKGEKGCYQKAMEEMEKKYEEDLVTSWRNALWKGGDLIGIQLDGGKDEGTAVEEIVKKVSTLLNRVHLEVAKYPVGIDRRLDAVRRLLLVDPHVNDVYMVGLLGQGGAGKTTLAYAICNDISDKFDSWCFLPKVRETASGVINGLAQLQETLLRKLLSDRDSKVWSVDEGKVLIKERLRNKRVLLILDDVDASNQLDALAGNSTWFGKGSRIIITTRDKHVLTSSDFKCTVYPVELLGKGEAITLFLLHAFRKKQGEVNIDSALIDSMVKYAGELPLALVVLGAFLFGRRQPEWEGKLKELNESPDGSINSVLKISFDGLEDNHKEIFLDVACFFRGRKINYVKEVLDSCGFATSLGIEILTERCLVTVVDEKIHMHDLLCAMGQSIARDDCLKRNEIPRRILLYGDLLDILSKDWPMKERQAVKGIAVDFRNKNDDGGLIKFNELKGFEKLRILILRNVDGLYESVQLPRELRWLEWRGYSASSIEFDPSSKLIFLDLANSKIQQINLSKKKNIQQINGKGFKELMFGYLSKCSSLIRLPDHLKCFKREDLLLQGCESLMGLEEGIGSLQNLVHLNLTYCEQLTVLPRSLTPKRLQSLNFYWCHKLEKLPAINEDQKFLKELDLSGTAITELPDSFCNLMALKELSLVGCTELTTIPSSIYKLQALEVLSLVGCSKLSGFPRRADTTVIGCPNLVRLYIPDCKLTDLEFLNDLTCFETLKKVNLSCNNFTEVPACISRFNNLEYLWMAFCNQLRSVSELPNVSWLSLMGCRWLKTLPSLHTFIPQSPESFRVELSHCHSLDGGFLDRSLPLETVRGFVKEVNVLVPGEEFPHWVNEAREYGSLDRVSIPSNMLGDDLLGLALFITPHFPERHRSRYPQPRVGGFRLPPIRKVLSGVHSQFVYIPSRLLRLNGPNMTLDFEMDGMKLKRWGMRLLCKQEQDDHGLRSVNTKDDESDSSGSEDESSVESNYDADYESAQSEW